MLALAPVFAYIFGFTVLGTLLKKLRLLTPERVRVLSWTAINVTLPALLVASLHRSPALDLSLLWLPAAGWIVLLLSCVLGYVLLLRILKLPPREAVSLFLPAVLGNVTFVGYPALSALLGDPGLVRGILFDQLSSGIFLATFVVAMCEWAAAGQSAPVSRLIKGVLTFPPLWGLVLGFALKGIVLPEILVTLLAGIGSATTPFFLIGLGATLTVTGWRETWTGALSVSAFKLLLMPLIAVVIFRLMPMPRIDLQVAILQTAMPSALSSVSMAIAYGLESRLVVNGVALSLVLSVVTLPFWAWLLGLG